MRLPNDSGTDLHYFTPARAGLRPPCRDPRNAVSTDSADPGGDLARIRLAKAYGDFELHCANSFRVVEKS